MEAIFLHGLVYPGVNPARLQFGRGPWQVQWSGGEGMGVVRRRFAVWVLAVAAMVRGTAAMVLRMAVMVLGTAATVLEIAVVVKKAWGGQEA